MTTVASIGEPGPATAQEPANRQRRAEGNPVLRFVLRRLVGGIITLFVVSILIFLVLQILPGNIASVVLGKNATPQAIAQLQHQLGLDRPVYIRYGDWIQGVLHGDLGNSAALVAQGSTDPSVWSQISTPLLNSAYLAGITVALLVPLSLLLGSWSAVRARKIADHVISVASLTFGAMPEFLVGTIFIAVFFSWLDILPPVVSIGPGQTPFSRPDQLVLPVATLLAVCLAYTTRMVRAGTIEALQQDFVAMARLNGIRERRVVWRYALRNALAPSIQAIAQTITYLAGGIIITESVFNYPGIGNFLVKAVGARDVTTVADVALLLAAFYVTVNILADLIVVFLVPKLRTSL